MWLISNANAGVNQNQFTANTNIKLTLNHRNQFMVLCEYPQVNTQLLLLDTEGEAGQTSDPSEYIIENVPSRRPATKKKRKN